MKIVVYGLGQEFVYLKELIESKYEVLGYSDKKKIEIQNYIEPQKINELPIEGIFITSVQYFDEIEGELKEILDEDGQITFLSQKNLFGANDNLAIRDMWVVNELKKIGGGQSLLDAGAGEAKYAKYCTHLKYTAQDFGEYNPEDCSVGLQNDKWDYLGTMVKCDIIDMPFQDDSFDNILCTEVFEHIKNPILAVKEFSRILCSGGKLILTAPFASLVHMAPYYYSSGFSQYWYKENLQDNGFIIQEIQPYGDYFSWLKQELSRIPNICEKYLNKQPTEEEMKAIYKVRNVLFEYSTIKNKSDEILNYGYCVIAKKR